MKINVIKRGVTNMQKHLPVISAILLVLIFSFSIINLLESQPRYGMIDREKVVMESVKGKEFIEDIENKRTEYEQKFLEEAQEIKNDRQKLDSRRAFYENKYQTYREERTLQFGKEFDKALEKLAKDKRLEGVFTKDSLRYSKYNLTEELIERLK